MALRLHPLDPGRRSLAPYAAAVGDEAIAELRRRAVPLRGLRVLQVSASPLTAPAVDDVRPLAALLADLGIESQWVAAFGDERLSATARALREGVRGGEAAIDRASWAAYCDAWSTVELPRTADLVVLHDPEALAATGARAGSPANARWTWRPHVHVDLADPSLAPLLGPLLAELDHGADATEPAPPFVDPLGPRGLELPHRAAGTLARAAGVDLSRPFVLHIADLDAWADPEGAVEAWRVAKAAVPELQLVIVARIPAGVEPSWRPYGELADHATRHADVHLRTSIAAAGDAETGALERLARVAITGSLDGGHGAAVPSALWRGTPVVAAATRGAATAMLLTDGETGFVRDDPEAQGAAIAALVGDPGLAAALGRTGRERVLAGATVIRRLVTELDLLAAAAGIAEPGLRPRPGSIAGPMHALLPDDTKLELPDGATGADAAAAIGAGLARAALAIEVDGELRDLARPLPDGARISIITERSRPDALDLIRHDTAHVLAAAVMDLYPGREDLDRPADRGRLLLRLRVPRGREALRGRLRRDRGEDARAHQGR